MFAAYAMSIGVGDPATNYTVIIDTGSSNTWVGATKPYVTTETSISTGEGINITYGSGVVLGKEWLDTVTLASGLIIHNQSIGAASNATGFAPFEGIIGLGPTSDTNRTVFNETTGSFINGTIPTVMDNALAQGVIDTEVLGVSFSPITGNNSNSSINGQLSFGGIDQSRLVGDVTYTPRTSKWPASRYWGIDANLTYGQTALGNDSSNSGIVDTGTSVVVIADDLYDIYLDAIPGAYYDNVTQLTAIPLDSVSSLQNFTVYISGEPFVLDAVTQLLPADQNVEAGGVVGLRYSYITPLGWNTTSGLFDWVLGMKFLERYYAVFDTQNNQVGLAYTNHTFAAVS
ncbi:hypothetical protein EVJ58_g6129 [Rhodofomes roseus]|nr:hypothetical protein EVJ58_g6129 [Rhodofomes roseus]